MVFTEGAKTEGGYLLPWRREFRDRLLISVDSFHGVPQSLVERAVSTRKAELRDQRRGRGRAHDEIWCVFDVDSHLNIREAVQQAEDNGICLAISNPCIELWFILHFEDQTAYISRNKAQSRSAELLGCEKNLSQEARDLLYSRFEDASQRARLLDIKHKGDGSPLRS
ncbi:MAG: RloB family protein, partial [bacterium]|nr:RloB family protein [bacterium]